MAMVRFDRSALPAQPWKNGGGVTRELVCRPEGSDLAGFDWRVSIAWIASSGPFSAFAGIDRVITLLEGPGVRLRSATGDIDHRLDRPLEPFAFPGEAAVQADLLGAPCEDLNVMTRRSACRADVQVLHDRHTLPRGRHGLLLSVRGVWDLQDGDLGSLAAGEGLWWHDADQAWSLAPREADAALVAVLVTELPR